jgi:riboflavin synthase
VDCTGTIKNIMSAGDSKVLTISIPLAYMKYIVSKGSVAIDGISLTVVDTGGDWFTVSLVQYTLDHTNMGEIKKDTRVNIEVDILAKYIESFLQKRGV